jgi:hypothetical protein
MDPTDIKIIFFDISINTEMTHNVHGWKWNNAELLAVI